MKRLILLVLAVGCFALTAVIANWVLEKKVSGTDELIVDLNGQNMMTAYSSETLPSMFASCDPFVVELEGYVPIEGVYSQENTLNCSPGVEFHVVLDLQGMKFSLKEGGDVRVTMRSPGIILLLVETKSGNFLFYSVIMAFILMMGLIFGWNGLRRDYY